MRLMPEDHVQWWWRREWHMSVDWSGHSDQTRMDLMVASFIQHARISQVCECSELQSSNVVYTSISIPMNGHPWSNSCIDSFDMIVENSMMLYTNTTAGLLNFTTFYVYKKYGIFNNDWFDGWFARVNVNQLYKRHQTTTWSHILPQKYAEAAVTSTRGFCCCCHCRNNDNSFRMHLAVASRAHDEHMYLMTSTRVAPSLFPACAQRARSEAAAYIFKIWGTRYTHTIHTYTFSIIYEHDERRETIVQKLMQSRQPPLVPLARRSLRRRAQTRRVGECDCCVFMSVTAARHIAPTKESEMCTIGDAYINTK